MPAPALTGRLVFQVSSGGDIYTMKADGSGLRRLTRGLDPALSPDGRQVAFVRWEGSQRGLFVVPVEGAAERFLFGVDKIKEPAWTPDGTRIVFSRQTGGKPARKYCFPRFGCFTLPEDPFWRLGMVRVADGAFQDIPSDLHSHSPSIGSDGDLVLYAGDKGLKTARLGDGSQGQLLADFFPASPALSPDGRQIAYMTRVGERWDLFLAPAQGGGKTRLTGADTPGGKGPNNVAPAWSPDGRHIAFLSDRDSTWRLYVMNADGSGQAPLAAAALAGVQFRYEFAQERVVDWGP